MAKGTKYDPFPSVLLDFQINGDGCSVFLAFAVIVLCCFVRLLRPFSSFRWLFLIEDLVSCRKSVKVWDLGRAKA